MYSTENKDLSIEYYKEAVNDLEIFTKIILFEFLRNVNRSYLKDTIIRNFIAKGLVFLKSILKLTEIKHHQDCLILYRCLLDRLFHLHALSQKDDFDLFEKWSFKQQYEYRNKIRSDPEFKKRPIAKFFKVTKEDKEKYARICKEQLQWERPHMEKIAKDMKLDFLYKYGYDCGSTHVHPMANDGQDDFAILMGLPRGSIFTEQKKGILGNACLVTNVLIQEGLNTSSFKWRRLIFNFLENYRKSTNKGSKDYLKDFNKICYLSKNGISLVQN